MMITTTVRAEDKSRMDSEINQSNWDLDTLAGQILRQCLDNRKTIASQDILQVTPAAVVNDIKTMAWPPQTAGQPDQVLKDAATIFGYRARMDHPRFFGFIPSPASDLAWLGDVLNSTYNTHAGSWYQSSGPSAVENTLLSWLATAVGLPSTAGGCFVSGGSMANLTAMAVARDRMLAHDERPRSTIYLSSQTHSSAAKGLHILGFHPNQIRRIECDQNHRIDVDRLEEAIQCDKDGGQVPFLIIANFGTTNTGSIDPLVELSGIARRHKLWLHADGAYGASIALSLQHHHLAEDIKLCDSLSWDAHKWLFQTYACGLVLVRDRHWLTQSFATSAEYIQDAAEGAQEYPNFWNYGMELTRPARAMKLWFFMRMTGLEAVGKMIDHGVLLAETAEREIRLLRDWSVESPAQLGIVCFRYAPERVPPKAWDDLNQAIQRKATESNFAAPLTTRIRGNLVLRMCSIHPELRQEEMIDIVRGLDEIAQSLLPAILESIDVLGQDH